MKKPETKSEVLKNYPLLNSLFTEEQINEFVADLLNLTKLFFDARKEHLNTLLTFAEKKAYLLELIKDDRQILAAPMIVDLPSNHWAINRPFLERMIELTSFELDYLEQSNTLQQATPGQPETDFDKSLSEIKNSKNQFVISMPMEKVINHFKVFTEKKSKNSNPFLTQEQFISFLQKAFLKKQGEPKQKLNYANGEKGFVIKRFYEFFNLSVTEYNELNKKDKYIKLLSDNFTNWKSIAIKDMFKPNKAKANW